MSVYRTLDSGRTLIYTIESAVARFLQPPGSLDICLVFSGGRPYFVGQICVNQYGGAIKINGGLSLDTG